MGRSCLLWLLAVSGMQGGPLQAASKSLNQENVRHFQISIEKGLYGVLRRGSEILTVPEKSDFYISSQYDAAPKEQDLAFGSLHNPLDRSERIRLGPDSKARFLRGIAALAPYLLFLDSGLKQFLVWNEKAKSWHQPADIIFDLLRPPADARGEAPSAEISRLRQKIIKEYRTFGQGADFVAGMALLPAAWRKSDDSQFLLLVRLPIAPLLTVRCEGQNFGRCLAQRACFVSGLSLKDLETARGVAVEPDRDEVWIGLPESQQIRRFRAKNCYGIREQGNIALDKDFQKISAMSFDEEKNLWITLSEPDRLRDSSLFRWDAQVIDGLLR